MYTKTGDNGTTSLFGAQRISKSDPRINAYGTVDELASYIGLLIEKIPSNSDKKFLTNIQKDLYLIMSSLAGGPIKETVLKKNVGKIERRIDETELKLPKLTRFILPQGSEITALSHIVRAVARRSEREVVGYLQNVQNQKSKSQILRYLNRLSDFLFVLARFYSKKEVVARIAN
ncbi:cob(I)yrinic acid a,c-diamide adenosyltransferase [Candidatus Roizmanbacteria bacterium]|nr:cob(I)yrinic acid a,c-diamide adenosyltransferase [Candidatus Roizmanbacteria bacterium]